MDCKDLLLDGFGRVAGNVQVCLDGLHPDQLTFRPAEQANSIGWLAWHLTRVQDDHVSDLAHRPQAWIEQGWHARFDRAADEDDTGFGHSAEEVARLRPSSAQLLLDYYMAVHARSLEYLHDLSCADLDQVLEEEPWWDPPVTVGVRLVSVIDDCLQHSGQMAYIRGLLEARHWFPA